MSGTPVLLERSNTSPQATSEYIREALNHLPPESLNELMQFIRFLEYKARILPADSQTPEAERTHNTYQPNSHDEFVKEESLATAYQQMAKDEDRESEALEWSEATIGDASDETR